MLESSFRQSEAKLIARYTAPIPSMGADSFLNTVLSTKLPALQPKCPPNFSITDWFGWRSQQALPF
ncbi:MAG: hypothetical protein VKL00_07375 [Synechococcales bacterium]|nr:hypothetical protein [Synechococcales bacterium]